jgi:predicted patatin/cPLA2 family phospholipase
MTKSYKEIVIGSGGIYGISLLGAINVFYKYYSFKKIKYYTGCSFGSIVCFLLVIGYSMDDVNNIIVKLDIEKFQELKIYNFIDKCGLDNGNKIYKLFEAVMLNKNIDPNITFEEFYLLNRKVLTFTVTNITKGIPEYHNYINTPTHSVLLSLRMSMNVPILFSPIMLNNSYYIDGALLDPFPYLYNKSVSLKKKIGFCLFDQYELPFMKQNRCSFIKELDNSFNYFINLIKILQLNYLKKYYKKMYKNVIYIKYNNNLSSFQNLSISINDKYKLFSIGAKKAYVFFNKKLNKFFTTCKK